jgi:hypothetical protein
METNHRYPQYRSRYDVEAKPSKTHDLTAIQCDVSPGIRKILCETALDSSGQSEKAGRKAIPENTQIFMMDRPSN